MTDPMGYFDILSQTVEIYTLIGFLVLFFFERGTYGRESIGHTPWGNVFLYNIATAGAYGIYWRLKVTFALHSRDRLASWQWVFVLVAIFALYMTSSWILLMLLIWDFVLGRRLTQVTGQPFSWIWTVIFGHLYLASFVEREASRLPVDFRMPHPQRRQRIIRIYSAVAVLTLMGIGLTYWNLWEQRKNEFAKIPGEVMERQGHWEELDEKYETVYTVDQDGRMDIHTWIKNPGSTNSGHWAHYQRDTKLHDGQLVTYNWFSCVEKYQIVEMKYGQLVLKNSDEKTLIDNQIEENKFTSRLWLYKQSPAASLGWQWGEFLKSPWNCEWRPVTGSGLNSWNSLKQELFERLWK